MNKQISTAFNDKRKTSKLSADGNLYSKDFTSVSVTITTKRGKFVDYYSHTQKNVTGLINQCSRFLDRVFVEGKHIIEVKVD